MSTVVHPDGSRTVTATCTCGLPVTVTVGPLDQNVETIARLVSEATADHQHCPPRNEVEEVLEWLLDADLGEP
jgi:hypothetical protein